MRRVRGLVGTGEQRGGQAPGRAGHGEQDPADQEEAHGPPARLGRRRRRWGGGLRNAVVPVTRMTTPELLHPANVEAAALRSRRIRSAPHAVSAPRAARPYRRSRRGPALLVDASQALPEGSGRAKTLVTTPTAIGARRRTGPPRQATGDPRAGTPPARGRATDVGSGSQATRGAVGMPAHAREWSDGTARMCRRPCVRVPGVQLFKTYRRAFHDAAGRRAVALRPSRPASPT